jgi:methyl-accepting chemotaxis protein
MKKKEITINDINNNILKIAENLKITDNNIKKIIESLRITDDNVITISNRCERIENNAEGLDHVITKMMKELMNVKKEIRNIKDHQKKYDVILKLNNCPEPVN